MCWTVSGIQPIVIRNNEEERFEALRGQRAFDNIIVSPGPGSPDRPQVLFPPPLKLALCFSCFAYDSQPFVAPTGLWYLRPNFEGAACSCIRSVFGVPGHWLDVWS